MRIGIFGGSFDPPHVGHLLAASDAVEALGLDRLVFVPAAVSPFKQGRTATAPADRLAMMRDAAGDDARFVVEAIEIDRDGLSYSVDTLESLASRSPGAELVLLIGEDVLPTFPQWRDPARIQRLARVAVLRRGDTAEAELAAAARPLTPPPLLLRTRRIDVSSTEVRARARAGLPLTGFVPDAVAAYIARAQLYR